MRGVDLERLGVEVLGLGQVAEAPVALAEVEEQIDELRVGERLAVVAQHGGEGLAGLLPLAVAEEQVAALPLRVQIGGVELGDARVGLGGLVVLTDGAGRLAEA